MKILLGQLGANGDCLYATTVARQLKNDFPNATLTWAISTQCAHLLANNPFIDNVWQWPIKDWEGHISAWHALERTVLRNHQANEPFDKIILSQIIPGNIRNYDGTIRPSIFRALKNKITVPIDSVIELSDSEKNNVENFAKENNLTSYDHVFLFECSSKSGQSKVTPDYAFEVARQVGENVPASMFILSTHEEIKSDLNNVVSAKSLSMRENAALTHYCSMFIGCGSGLTVVATSSAGKPIPNIQILNSKKSVYASFFHDFEYFGKSGDRFIEMGDATKSHTAKVILSFIDFGHEVTRQEFHQPIPVHFEDYIERVDRWANRSGKYVDALESLMVTVERYGWCDELVRFGKQRVAKLIKKDPIMLNDQFSDNLGEFLEFLSSG